MLLCVICIQSRVQPSGLFPLRPLCQVRVPRLPRIEMAMCYDLRIKRLAFRFAIARKNIYSHHHHSLGLTSLKSPFTYAKKGTVSLKVQQSISTSITNSEYFLYKSYSQNFTVDVKTTGPSMFTTVWFSVKQLLYKKYIQCRPVLSRMYLNVQNSSITVYVTSRITITSKHYQEILRTSELQCWGTSCSSINQHSQDQTPRRTVIYTLRLLRCLIISSLQ